MAAPPPRRAPRKEVPSAIQIDVRPTVMLARGLAQRCPACGGGHIFHRWFRMEERCPTCTLLFERVEGHWIGSLGLNTTVVFGTMLIVLLAGSLIGYPHPPYGALLIAEIAIALFGPLLFFPSSRMMWTAMDLLMRPLRPGEIDPRYVTVDPERDRLGQLPGMRATRKDPRGRRRG
ncbi:hypothetical protein [Dermatobacter hominis]|uniref:hypothetical protein n=1 Tax=Dermatobacter hominis TaxID=2884263 RepID=UPI001D116FF0|nr:hypothetical protein [Dermatobacter hominis]UDY34236.1 hypothetical protein LH044_12900 [Dermatobacter hominis]